MQLLKNKPIRDMKKLFFYCVIVFFITSCASFKYSKNYENTFNLTSNVDQVIVSNKSGNQRLNNTSSSYQNHNYEVYIDKINNKYLSLQVTKNNYDTVYLKLKKQSASIRLMCWGMIRPPRFIINSTTTPARSSKAIPFTPPNWLSLTPIFMPPSAPPISFC